MAAPVTFCLGLSTGGRTISASGRTSNELHGAFGRLTRQALIKAGVLSSAVVNRLRIPANSVSVPRSILINALAGLSSSSPITVTTRRADCPKIAPLTLGELDGELGDYLRGPGTSVTARLLADCASKELGIYFAVARPRQDKGADENGPDAFLAVFVPLGLTVVDRIKVR